MITLRASCRDLLRSTGHPWIPRDPCIHLLTTADIVNKLLTTSLSHGGNAVVLSRSGPYSVTARPECEYYSNLKAIIPLRKSSIKH